MKFQSFRFRSLTAVLLTIFTLLAPYAAAPAAAQDCTTGCPSPALPQPRRDHETAAPERLRAAPAAPTAPFTLPALRAVVIVGPIDGPEGDWTHKEIRAAELTAAELEGNGVTVSRFYSPTTPWDEIVQAAAGAHFFIYYGHGVSWGGEPPVVGGLYLDNGLAIPSAQLQSDLHLAPGAVVMLYACFAAGSSSSDAAPGIDAAEATRRVAQYAAPFLANGAGLYYADWNFTAFRDFTADLFAAKTAAEAYREFNFTADSITEFVETVHPDGRNAAMWLKSDFYNDASQWNHALVGQPEATLATLFAPTMEVGVTEISVSAAPTAPAQPFEISVSSNAAAPFTWTASLESQPAWITIVQGAGQSGDSITLTLDPHDLQPGTYATSLRVTATTPGILQADQTLPIELTVTAPETEPAAQVRSLYLPFVISY
jgi:hypothetical protein